MSRQLTPCRPPARYAGSRRHTKLAPRAVGHKPPPLAVILGAALSRKPPTNVSRETLAPATRPPHSQPSTLHSPIDSPPASPANPEPTFRVLRTRPRSPHLRPLSGARRQPQPCCRRPPAAIRHPPPTLCQAPAVVRSPSAASHSPADSPPAAKRKPQLRRPTSCHPPPQPRRPTTHSRTNHQLPPPCSEHACAQSSLWLTSLYPNRYPRMRYLPRRITARPRETVSCSNTQYWGKWLPCHILTT